MPTLHLLDATYELFRGHFSPPHVDDPAGRPVGAVFGVINTMLALLNDEEVTHIAAATDTVIRSFRNEMFAGYKDEGGVEPELLAQFPLAERALEALGVTVWPMREYEADDGLATAAARFRDQATVRILSPDKDMAQCVRGKQVVMVDRRREIVYDEAGVKARWGVAPESIPDYLALVGDDADGIPGLPGWGAKSTAAVLARYGHLEEIPKLGARWDVGVRGAQKLGATLQGMWDEALLYRALATLREDVPLTETLADLEWRGVPRGPYEAFCDEMGFTGLKSRPVRWAGE